MELLFVQTKEKPINDFDLRLNPRLHYKQIESKNQLNYSSSQSNEQSNRTNKPHTNKSRPVNCADQDKTKHFILNQFKIFGNLRLIYINCFAATLGFLLRRKKQKFSFSREPIYNQEGEVM